MKHTYKLFTLALILTLNLFMGCSLNTVGRVGNSFLEAVSDVNIFTDAEELQFGQAFVAQHEQEIKLYTDPVVTNYINDLGQFLVRYSKRNNIPYTFKVVDTKGIKCVCCTGRVHFMFTLISSERRKPNRNFAAVIGHEIGHIVGRHSMKRLHAGLRH